jgi:hypothetical protein
MATKRHWKVSVPAVAFVLALLGSAPRSDASIPGADGQIHACYQVNNGQVRVIDTDAGQSCRPSELAIQWRVAATLGCPVGTVLVINVCVETAARAAAPHFDAAPDCADEGKRLPSPGELKAPPAADAGDAVGMDG